MKIKYFDQLSSYFYQTDGTHTVVSIKQGTRKHIAECGLAAVFKSCKNSNRKANLRYFDFVHYHY